MQIVRVSDLATPLHRILIYGDSGAGKTTAAARAPNPIVLLTEVNGVESIRAVAPNAGLVLATGPSALQTVKEFVDAALAGKFPDGSTLVVDSLLEIQRHIQDAILRRSGRRGNEEAMTIAEWGTLAKKMADFLRALRSVPYPVICTTLATWEKNEVTGEMLVRPSFLGKKTGEEMPQWFSAVGYLRREPNPEGGPPKRYVVFDGPSSIVCKPAPSYNPVMPPDASAWLS